MAENKEERIVDCGDHYEIKLYKKVEVARALIDKDDFYKIKDYRWVICEDNHVRGLGKDGTRVYLHRLVFHAKNGFMVDHKNRNPLDNRKCNLRHADSSLNTFNKANVAGVWLDKRSNKWIPEIQVKGKRIRMGSCATREEAIKIRREAELKYFGFNPSSI